MAIRILSSENITGNITVSGNVDGRDIAADGLVLDAIEAGADVTDTTNVVAALTAGTNIAFAADGTISSTDTFNIYIPLLKFEVFIFSFSSIFFK